MSLIPIYVRANNGEFYKDPIIRGNDFYICFDDDDPPELIIMRNKRTLQQLKKRAIQIFKELKIKAKESGEPNTSWERCFSKDERKTDFRQAYSVFIKITAPIPVSIITKHEGLYNGKGEGAFECFEDLNFHKWIENKRKSLKIKTV